MGTTARLEFYDWEANVLTPSGKIVASGSRLGIRRRRASARGSSANGPGGSGRRQHDALPGGQARGQAAAVRYRRPTPGWAPSTSFSASRERRVHGRRARCQGDPAGRSAVLSRGSGANGVCAEQPAGAGGSRRRDAAQGQSTDVKVKQGWVVIEAVTPARTASAPRLADPASPVLRLRDNVALFGNDITNPQQSTDQSGSPDVSFGFTGTGGNAFQNVTATIAKRGQLVSARARKLFQHFAVALDTQLVTVPYIDYTANPYGIPGDSGADHPGRVHDQLRRGTWPGAAAGGTADQAVADLHALRCRPRWASRR